MATADLAMRHSSGAISFRSVLGTFATNDITIYKLLRSVSSYIPNSDVRSIFRDSTNRILRCCEASKLTNVFLLVLSELILHQCRRNKNREKEEKNRRTSADGLPETNTATRGGEPFDCPRSGNDTETTPGSMRSAPFSKNLGGSTETRTT